MWKNVWITTAVLLTIAFVGMYYYYMYMLFETILGTALPIVVSVGAVAIIAVFLWKYLEGRQT